MQMRANLPVSSYGSRARRRGLRAGTVMYLVNGGVSILVGDQ